MGFIGVLAATMLLRAYVLDAGTVRRQIAWMGAAGAALAVCFLIRIEPGILFSVVWAGLAVLYPFGDRGQFLPRFRTVALGTSLGLAAFIAVHAPFAADAYRRGFGPQFTAQYLNYVHLLRWELSREWEHWLAREPESAPAAPAVDPPPTDASAKPATQAKTETEGRDGRRPRPALAEVFTGRGVYFFGAAIWMPALVAAVLAASGGVLLACSLFFHNATNKTRALVVLGSTGCALALFPQYFFFRPDSVHLNEFLVAFWPAALCSAWVLIQAARDSGRPAARLWSAITAVLVVLLFIVSFNALFGRDGSGSIMSARGADAPFSALNGVRSRVKASELRDWEGLRDAVLAHAAPGQFVVTYPYVPIINVMCDRPSYQWSLYVDNATAVPGFQQHEGSVLRDRKPAVIVINDRAINRTESSRFSRWASQLHGQIVNDYSLVGTFFDRVEVYALRRPPAPAAP
jgi:hypothetical protein